MGSKDDAAQPPTEIKVGGLETREDSGFKAFLSSWGVGEDI